MMKLPWIKYGIACLLLAISAHTHNRQSFAPLPTYQPSSQKRLHSRWSGCPVSLEARSRRHENALRHFLDRRSKSFHPERLMT
jgi:hypothetical protein